MLNSSKLVLISMCIIYLLVINKLTKITKREGKEKSKIMNISTLNLYFFFLILNSSSAQ